MPRYNASAVEAEVCSLKVSFVQLRQPVEYEIEKLRLCRDYAAARVERLPDQIAIAPIDEAAVSESHARACLHECDVSFAIQ